MALAQDAEPLQVRFDVLSHRAIGLGAGCVALVEVVDEGGETPELR